MDPQEQKELREIFSRFKKAGLLEKMRIVMHDRAISLAINTDSDKVALTALDTARVVNSLFANIEIWIDGQDLSDK